MLTKSNGDTYEGETVNGKPHGKGKLTYYVNGTVYEGDFVNGEPHGKGKITENSVTFVEGEFVNGKMHGKGKIFGSDCQVEGDFVNFNIFIIGSNSPELFFYNLNFKGKINTSNGQIECEFVNGKPHGKGKLTSPDGVLLFHGEPNGKVKLFKPDGRVEEFDWDWNDIIK